MLRQKPASPPAADNAAQDLRTVRDFVRYAVTRFHDADIDYGHGTDNAVDEAAFIILESLCLPHDSLEPWLDCALTLPERVEIAGLINERVRTRKPASYLLQRAYIQGRPFYVDERVIVPRSFIGEIMWRDSNNPLRGLKSVDSVLDLCTGSGCLAIMAAELFPDAVVDAADLSADALAVAAINVRDYDLEGRVNLLQGDLFAPVAGNKYDVIITNPPYVDEFGMGILTPEHQHEPEMALVGGGPDGMDIVRAILAQAADHLNPGGVLVCELGRGKAAIAAQFPDLPLQWLATENSDGEVFWITREGLAGS
jgi:ribosomal protein L3 glutamine methyltransferase